MRERVALIRRDDGTYRRRVRLVRVDVIDPIEVDRLVLDVVPIQFQRALEPEFQRLVADFGSAALDEVGAIGASFNLIDAKVLGYLNDLSSRKIVGITRTLRRSIQIELQKGVLAGEGADAIARRIRSVFAEASRLRARTIARTEVIGAANEARLQAFAQSGVIKHKRWNSTLDSRLRATHRQLHGQVRPIRAKFRIPGTTKTAQRPGGFGIPEEDINCRCAVLPVLSTRRDAPSDPDRKTIAEFDRRTLRWEERIAATVRSVYRRLESQIVEDLRRADLDL